MAAQAQVDKRGVMSPIQIRPAPNDGNEEGVGGKPFVCPFPDCRKQFARKSNLTRHSRIHSKEKRFKCPSCEKTFTEKHHLTAHARTHTGERPYTCLACSRQFTDRSNMLRHVRTHGDAAVQMHQMAEDGRIQTVDEKGLVPLVASMGRPTIATAVPSPNFSAVPKNGVSLRPRTAPRDSRLGSSSSGKALPPVIATLLNRPQTRESTRRTKVARGRTDPSDDVEDTESEGDIAMSKSAAKRAKIKPLDTQTAEAADVLLNMNTPTQTPTRGFPGSPISVADLGAPADRRKTLRSSRTNDLRRINMDSMTPTAAAAMGLSPLASTLSPYMGNFSVGTPMSYSSNSPFLSSYGSPAQGLQCIISIPTPVVANVVPQARLTPNMEAVQKSPTRFPVPVTLPMSYSAAAMSNGTTDSTFSSQTSALRSIANASSATMMPSMTPTAVNSSGGFTIGGPHRDESRESPSVMLSLQHPLSVSPALNTDYLTDPGSMSFSITTPTSLLFPTSQMAPSPAHGWSSSSSGFADRMTPLPQAVQISNKS